MAKKDKNDRPQAAQLDSVRRLARQGKLGEAVVRLAVLKKQFPGFKPLWALAWEVARDGGNTEQACGAALDWSRASPNSEAAWSALQESAGLEYASLAYDALRRVQALQGKTVADEPAPAQTAYGPLVFQDAVRLDLCRVLLALGRLEEAEEQVRGVDHVSARNNIGIVKFAQGKLGEAADLMERVWREYPGNLLALDRLVRLRLWQGGMDAASELAGRLVNEVPARDQDRHAQVDALVLLDRIEEAEAAWLDGREKLEYPMEASFSLVGAYLAWRRGRLDEALERLEAADAGEYSELQEDLAFSRLGGDTPDWAIGEPSVWWPLAGIVAMQALAEDETALMAYVNELGVHNNYLARMAEIGGRAGRGMALLFLKNRAKSGDVGAVETLKSLLARPCGPDYVRTDLQAWLVEEGFLSVAASITMWLRGEAKELRARRFRINYEAMEEEDLPPADAGVYEKALKAVEKDDLSQAEALLAGLLSRHPDHPRLLANLANIRYALGQPLDKFEGLVQRALEVAPDYSFALVARANVLMARNRVDEAAATLERLMDQEELHVSEWRACLGVQLDVAKTKGDVVGMREILRQLAAL